MPGLRVLLMAWLGGAGCAQAGEALGEADAWVPEGPACRWGNDNTGRPPVAADRLSADGCIECSCDAFSNANPPTRFVDCEPTFCKAPTRCDTTADCGNDNGYCHFDPGCTGERGYCTLKDSECADATNPPATPQDATAFCGCDGKNYLANRCIGIPWRRRGPC